jgi:hypothetical protein
VNSKQHTRLRAGRERKARKNNEEQQLYSFHFVKNTSPARGLEDETRGHLPSPFLIEQQEHDHDQVITRDLRQLALV